MIHHSIHHFISIFIITFFHLLLPFIFYSNLSPILDFLRLFRSFSLTKFLLCSCPLDSLYCRMLRPSHFIFLKTLPVFTGCSSLLHFFSPHTLPSNSRFCEPQVFQIGLQRTLRQKYFMSEFPGQCKLKNNFPFLQMFDEKKLP